MSPSPSAHSRTILAIRIGHPEAINLAVGKSFPELAAKYGPKRQLCRRRTPACARRVRIRHQRHRQASACAGEVSQPHRLCGPGSTARPALSTTPTASIWPSTRQQNPQAARLSLCRSHACCRASPMPRRCSIANACRRTCPARLSTSSTRKSQLSPPPTTGTPTAAMPASAPTCSLDSSSSCRKSGRSPTFRCADQRPRPSRITSTR